MAKVAMTVTRIPKAVGIIYREPSSCLSINEEQEAQKREATATGPRSHSPSQTNGREVSPFSSNRGNLLWKVLLECHRRVLETL